MFFYILKKHLNYLSQFFRLCKQKRINLTLTKLFLKYSLIILLNQHVNSLNFFIFEKKIIVITSLQFLKSLKNLNYFLNLIE